MCFGKQSGFFIIVQTGTLAFDEVFDEGIAACVELYRSPACLFEKVRVCSTLKMEQPVT
ncbi:hypothetical protein EVA_10609 [gut metagenome]|uniref:Uncharacterized protein n=1 Tax=gut metagenome TaxID=749906 RepID=J9CMG0_9ZZZZ